MREDRPGEPLELGNQLVGNEDSLIRKVVKVNAQMELIARFLRRGYLKFDFARVRLRRRVAMNYYTEKNALIEEWAPKKTELDNFYYGLTTRNIEDLQALTSVITGLPYQATERYVNELIDDRDLHHYIESTLKNDPDLIDVEFGFGRRLGWYVFVRALKPKLVVETGVRHGVGACVLAAALIRNLGEGYPGRYIGTDIDPSAGRLLWPRYEEVAEIIYGDSISTLEVLNEVIDIFINDSDHSSNYEETEYAIIAGKMAEQSLILGDNSHVSRALLQFALEHDRPYVFFKEEPAQHWYPGAGIGISPSHIPIYQRKDD